MLMPSVLPFFQGGRALRRYRTTMQQALHAEPALRLLPDLLALPLGAAPLPDPEAILATPASLGLVSGPASGRSLALLQVAARCSEASRTPAVYISLADSDQPGLTPRAVVDAQLARAGLPASIAGDSRPCLLLLDDYELLGANRRATWRTFVAGLSQNWPAARAVVALPPGETWPELQELHLAAPDDAILAAWLDRLLPDQPHEPILAALASEPLAALRGSLSDLLLLVLTYPISGLPTSRAALYEQAYALARPLIEAEPNAEQPPAPVRIGRATLRHYRLARGLAGGADLATLADLPAHELAAVAPLAAGLLDDPRPVLDLLWNRAENPAALAGLAACVRERPAAAPADGLRLLDRLAVSAADPEAEQIRRSLLAVAPATLVAAEPAPAITTLAGLIAAEPSAAPTLLLTVADDPAAAPELRWAAADHLAECADPAALLASPEGHDDLALAVRCYAVALGAPAARPCLLEPELRAGLSALLADAGGEARRRAVVTTLLDDPDTPAELRALALAAAPAAATDDRTLLERAVADPTTGVRRAALAVLSAGDPEVALESLAAVLTGTNLEPEAAHDALSAVAALPQTRAAALLGRCVINERIGLIERLHAVSLLAGRGREGAAVLLRLIELPGLAAPLRAAVARHLSALGVASALAPLRSALLAEGPLLVRRAAAAALGELARFNACREDALAGLIAALAGPWLDAPLAATIARGLAACGPAALPALGELLAPRLADDLRARWLAWVPDLARTPAAEWPGLAMPPAVRAALHEAMTAGETPADRPGGVEELAERQAAAVGQHAADALVALARRHPSLRREAALLLRRALRPGRPPELLTHLLDRLGDLLGDNPVALDALLDGLGESPQLRWLALERLGARPAGVDALIRRLQAGLDDGFTRAKIAELLGARHELSALPVLRHVAESRDEELHLRRSAAGAIGRLGDPAATAALLRLVADTYTPTEVRAAAAAALPGDLDPASCRLLREQVRAERPQAGLAAAVLAALGRAGDREALPLLMRYAQSDRPDEAVAAIEAIVALAEPSVAPALVRVTQASSATPGVRLAAVAALLELCGEEYLPLLRSYLESPIMPLRLRAHAALAAHDPQNPRLISPVADTTAPLALRLEALARLLARGADDEVLPLLLANPAEEPQLRLAAAAGLGRATRPEAAAQLRAALTDAELPLLRRYCLRSLAALAASESPAAAPARQELAALALDTAGPAEQALWAGEDLLEFAHP